jgi:hypothetical protein
MLDNQQTDDYSSYKGYQNPSYQNPTPYQRGDDYQNRLEESSEEEGQSIRHRGGTSNVLAPAVPDDTEWDRSFIEKEYIPEDEETRRKIVTRADKKLYLGGTTGSFTHHDKDELFRNFVDHTIEYFKLHHFSKGTAQNLANQLKECIVVDGHVFGIIRKGTADVWDQENQKKKKKKQKKKARKHRYLDVVAQDTGEPKKAEETKADKKVSGGAGVGSGGEEEEPEKRRKKRELKGFRIQVGYNLTMEAELEKSCISMFVPFTTYCFGWEPLLDKTYTLHYSLTVERLRGALLDKDVDLAQDQVPKDKKTIEKEKPGFLGRVVNSILDVSDQKKEAKKAKKKKKEKEKEKKKTHHKRHKKKGHTKGKSHKHHHHHHKIKDSDSTTDSSSDSESDTEESDSENDSGGDDSYSTSGSDLPKKIGKVKSYESPQQQQQQQYQQPPGSAPDPKPNQVPDEHE